MDCAGIFSVSTGSVRGMLVVAGSVDALEILVCFAVDGVHDSGNDKSDSACGITSGKPDIHTMISSLMLSKTIAVASSHVGIDGIFVFGDVLTVCCEGTGVVGNNNIIIVAV